MNKKLIILGLVLLAALFIATAVALAKTDLARLEIINKTDEPVSISLTAGRTYYFLTVAAGTTKAFTVERELYDRTTYSCGATDSGTVDIYKHFRLVFTLCPSDAPNQGEPTMEKVHINDSPSGINWYYK